MVSIAALQKRARACLGMLRCAPPPVDAAPLTSFLCNVCGKPNCQPRERLTRESGNCMYCGCYGRLRSIAYAVSARFSADDIILARMTPRKEIRGLGCSDRGYVDLLSEKFDYVDTFYDREPRLDLLNVDWSRWAPESFDFITCTDVLEHIEPPIDKTFDNMYRLLRPGGAAFITVPTTLEPHNREHFPDLNDWEIVEENEKRVLVNRRTDGAVERFDGLCYHGGEGMTLEFRRFSRQGLIDCIERAGFRVADIRDKSLDAYAIPLCDGNFVLTAEKPGANDSISTPCVDPYQLLGECQEEIAARRGASGPDPCDYASQYLPCELGHWLHIPRWIHQDFSKRAARGEYIRCLDVGCAYGTLLTYAAKLLHCKLFATDLVKCLDDKLIEDYGVRYGINDIERDKFPWKTRFEMIIFTEVLEHLNFNALPTLKKLRSLLFPGGRLYLSAPDAAQWGRQTKYHRTYSDLPDPSEAARYSAIRDHVWRYEEEELKRLLDAAGFRIERSEHSPGDGKRHFNMTLAAA